MSKKILTICLMLFIIIFYNPVVHGTEIVPVELYYSGTAHVSAHVTVFYAGDSNETYYDDTDNDSTVDGSMSASASVYPHYQTWASSTATFDNFINEDGESSFWSGLDIDLGGTDSPSVYYTSEWGSARIQLQGTIQFGTSVEYPAGSLIEWRMGAGWPVHGPADWQFTVWREDVNDPLAVINADNLIAEFMIEAGETLNMDFSHIMPANLANLSLPGSENFSDKIIITLPEPATLLLLGLGAAIAIRRH